MKKIIVLGATGNVGSYVFEYAVEFFNKKYAVIASGRRETDFFRKKGHEYFAVDISNEKDFDKFPQEGVEAVIYLAADIPAYMNGYVPERYIESNIKGAYNVLEYCRKAGVKSCIFSTSAYDVWEYVKRHPSEKIRADMQYDFSYSGDHALYVLSKNFAIELLKHYYAEYGLKYRVFRFPTIYSYSPNPYYYPRGKKTIRPIYKMIENAKKSEPIELWGDPNYSKDMVYVDDCAQMLCKSVEADIDFGFYNVGTGIPVSMKEQIETIIEIFSPQNNPSKIILRPDLPSGGGILMDIENAKRELGYEPIYDCHRLFEKFKEEMKMDRFGDLRL